MLRREPSRYIYFDVSRRLATQYVCVRFLGASLCALSGICDADASRLPQAEKLARVVSWLMESGKPVVIRKHIANAFGLGGVDISVRERGFKPPGQDLTEVCAVASNAPDILFLARVNEADGSAIVWKTSPSGKLDATVSFDPVEGAKLVSNSGHEAAFIAAKNYFIGKAKMDDPKAHRFIEGAAAVANSPLDHSCARNPTRSNIGLGKKKKIPAVDNATGDA